MTQSIGFFSSFNARHLGAEEVARAFVPNAKFLELSAVQNALLVGARGSGKTHMLKMLQPKALNAWEHPEANDIRQRISYWGVFVPADEAWRQQIQFTADQLSSDLQKRFTSSIFSTHVQRSLVDCFLQLVYDRPSNDKGFAKVVLTTEQENSLCLQLADSWKLRPLIHSLLGIRQALVDRAADLYEAADDPDDAAKVLENCQSQAVPAVLRGITAMDSIIGRYDGRWCLMFDELELAPIEIQAALFRCLRSTDTRLLFKLALSPATQAAEVFRDVLGPTAGNDFDEITLYSDPKEASQFCELLWQRLTEGTSAAGASPQAVLGHSHFHAPDAASPYGKRGRWQEASKSLALKDTSYRLFAERHGFDPFALDKSPRQQRDAVIRKIGPLVGFRDFFFRSNQDGQPRGFRFDKSKPAMLYSGWEVLCLVSEGNPRWFTGIVKRFLIQREKSPSQRDLGRESQYDGLVAASRKFMDYIATIPSPSIPSISLQEGGLKGLVELLIRSFGNGILVEDFTLDPVLSFNVDTAVSDEVRRAVFNGLYAGAFIPVDDEARRFAFSRDLVGQRLRLTYLIAPLGNLPLRTGKPRALSRLIFKSADTSLRAIQRRRSLVKSREQLLGGQAKLFNE